MVVIGNFFKGRNAGTDFGPVERDVEGAYRRGFHHAIAQVLRVLESGAEVTAESLSEWCDGPGMEWRNESLNRKIVPPTLIDAHLHSA